MKALFQKKVIIIPFICLSILLIGGILFFGIYHKELANEKEKMESLSKKQIESFKPFEEIVEYGTTWSYDDFFSQLLIPENLDSGTSVEIKIGEEYVNNEGSYTFLGTKEQPVEIILTNQYTYKIWNTKTKEIQNKKEYLISIVDTKYPVIEGVKDKEIFVGETFSLKDGIRAYDEVDGELEFQIEGEVNTKKAGETNIKITATDKNGNVSEKTFKVVVKEKTAVKEHTTSTNKTPSSSSSSTNKNQSTSSNDASTKQGRLNLAKAEAKKVYSSIIKPGMSDYDKAYAIYKYLHSNVLLQTNQSNEAYKTNFGNEAYAALVMKIAACSGFCKAVTILCDLAGLQSQHINAGKWTHQWNKVYIDGEWIILDAQGGIFGGTTHPLE